MGLDMTTPAPQEWHQVFYVLACRDCGDPGKPLLMPFTSAAERGRWAAEHTRATGHEQRLVPEGPAGGTGAP